MRIDYQHNESNSRGYQGISLDEQECREHLQGLVKDNLLDREERDDTLGRIRALRDETGFDVSDGLLADIQALEGESIEAQNFRVGEAYAEVILEQAFSCRFYWNELRVLPGTKNAVNLGTSLQFKWEHKYSKIGNKSTVISYNFINQVLPCRPIYKKGMQWTLDKNNLSSCTTRFNGFGR